jgi:hypothetical protein
MPCILPPLSYFVDVLDIHGIKGHIYNCVIDCVVFKNLINFLLYNKMPSGLILL